MLRAEAQETDKRSRATRWRIAHKLTVASTLMILLAVVAGGVGLWQVITIGQAIDEVHEKEQQLTSSLELMAAGHSLVAALDHMVAVEDSLLASTEVATSLGILTFYVDTLQESGEETGASNLLEEMRVAYGELHQAMNEVDLLARQERWTEAGAALEQKVRPANERMGFLIQQLVSQADQDVEATALRVQTMVRQAILRLAILVALTTAIAFGWREFVFRGLSLSISELRRGVARISSGDLEYKLDVRTGDEIEELGNEFNKMADQLADLIGNLEQRVAERTSDLERRAVQLSTAAEVSHTASSILDPDELIQQVVDLVRERFDLYYVGLFLLDEERKFAVLRAGTGEAGRKMLEVGYKLEVDGESMIGWCITNAQARIALDVDEEVVRFDNPLLPETRSELALPLTSRGQAIGALTIQSSQEAAFGEDDIAVLQTMADQLANAIENTRLFEETQTRAEELAILNEMGRVLTTMLDVQAVIESLYHHASRLIDTSHFYVALYDPERDMVSFPLYIEGGQRLQEEPRRSREGLTEYVIRTREPLLIEENVAARVEELGIGAFRLEAVSWLGVPMMIGERVIGVISAHSHTIPRLYNERHRDLLSAIANQAAIAIENARLYEEIRGRMEESSALYQVSRSLVSALGLDALLKQILEAIRDSFGYANAAILLLDESGTELYVKAASGFIGEAEGARIKVEKEGVTGWVAQHGEMLYVPDVSADSRYTEPVKPEEATQSEVALPLKVGTRLIGVLNVESTELDGFDERDFGILSSIADQAAMAIENVRLYEEAQKELAERKRAEEALRVSEERFALAVQGSNEGIWDWDIKNNTLYWSPRFKELLGYADDELDVDFDTFESHLHPDDRERMGAAIEAHLKDRGPYNVEQRLRTKSGEYRWFRARGQALWGEAGNPIRMVGSSTDITERKVAEEELAHERDLLHALMDNIPDTIYFKDAASRFTRINRAQAQVLGLNDPKEAIGKTDFDFFTPEHARDAYADEQEFVKSGQPLVDKVERIRRADGQILWVSATKVPITDKEGRVAGIVGISRDITERKQAEEKIEHLNLVLRAIRNVNQLITRERERDCLLQGACETLIETRGYHHAWIVLLDESGGVVTTAEAGLGEDFLPLVEQLKRGELTDCGRRTLKQSGGVVIEDPSTTCAACPLSSMYDGRGALAVRLEHGDKVYGLLSVSIPGDLAADEEEQALFEEVAGDIAFALHNIELEEERKEMEEALRKSEERINGIVTSIEDVLYSVDGETREFSYMSPAFERLLGYTLEDVREIGGRQAFMSQVIEGERFAEQEDTFEQLLSQEMEGVPAWEAWWRCKDGSLICLEDRSLPIYDGERLVSTYGVLRDITERKRAEEEAQRRAAQAMLVYEVGQRVSRKLELDELLSEIVTAMRAAFDYYGVMILLVDKEGKHLTMQSIAGGYVDIFPGDVRHAVGEGMTGYAAASGETQVSGDVSKDPYYVREADEETKSELAVPIKSGQKVIGVLDLQSDEFDAFDETDVMLMETLADQIAGAIESARLFEETRIRAEELAVLNEMGRVLTTMLDVDAVIESLYQHASRLIDTSHFYVALYDPEQDMVRFPLYIEEGQTIRQEPFRAGKGLSGYVIRTREPLLIEDNVAARVEELGIEAVKLESVSWLGVPMMIGDQVIGMISAHSHTTPRLYNEHHRDLLSAIANQAAIAIQNARLFEEARSRAERLAVVNRIARAASSTLDLDDLMETVYQEIASIFSQPDAFFIALYDEGTDELDFHFSVDEGVRQPPVRQSLGGLSSFAITEKKPLLVRDLEHEQAHLPMVMSLGTGKLPASWLGVPLLVGERPIGVINVQSYRPDVWDEEDEQLLLTIADQVAIALENARLFEEAHRRAQQLEVVNEVGQAITSVLDVDAVVRQIVDTTKSRFGYYFVNISMLEGDRITLRDASIIGDSDIRPKHGQVSLDLHGPGLNAEAARTGQPALLNDVRNDPHYVFVPELPDALAELCVPIKIKDRVIGVLDLESSRPNDFDQTDVALFQSLANQAGVALENASLYEQAQHEITERKAAEEALKKYSERLEEMVEERTKELRDAQEQLVRKEKLAVLGQLAGGVGHELRNPLGAISNAVYFLNMVLEEPDPEIKETLEILEKEVKTCELTISSLLDFARTKPPVRRKVDVNDVVREALSRTAVPENVEVVSQLGEVLPAILADPHQIGQVFGNIALNAVQAMPEGGRLMIKTWADSDFGEPFGYAQDRLSRAVEPSEVASPEWVAVSFADTGVGIAEENLDKLFEPLFTTKAKGIGLGMAVTKTLVEGHGGAIEVQSELGKGSTFTVRLPIDGKENK
jgi:PAS domain S-box-containing protein